MAEENVMRSFVTKLGFKVDDNQERKFDKSVGGATKQVLGLKTALAGLVAASAAGFYKITNDLSGLYFATKRLDASGRNLEAFGFAADQTGSSAEAARGSVEGLAAAIRKSPGREHQIQNLGVDTRDADGKMRSTLKIMQELLDVFDTMPQYRAVMWAEELKIQEKLMLGHRNLNEQFEKSQQQYKDRFDETMVKKLTEQSRKITKQFDLMGASFRGFAYTAAQSFGEAGVVGVLKKINAWLAENGKNVGDTIKQWSDNIRAFWGDATDAFDAVNKATSGWAWTLLGIVATLKVLTAGLIGVQSLMAVGAGAGGWALGSAFNDWLEKEFPNFAAGIGKTVAGFLGAFGLGIHGGNNEDVVGEGESEAEGERSELRATAAARPSPEEVTQARNIVKQSEQDDSTGPPPSPSDRAHAQEVLKRDARTRREEAAGQHRTKYDRGPAPEQAPQAKQAEQANVQVEVTQARALLERADQANKLTQARATIDQYERAEIARAELARKEASQPRLAGQPKARKKGGVADKLISIKNRVWNSTSNVDKTTRLAGMLRKALPSLDDKQIAGIIGNLQKESSLDPTAAGDDNEQGVAQGHGIAQWGARRRQAIEDALGFKIKSSSVDQQIKALAWEMKNTHQGAYKALKNADTADKAGRVVSRQYEVPGSTQATWDREARERGALSSRIYNTNTFHITGATDPGAVSREIESKLRQKNGSAIRNGAPITQ